MSKFRAKKCAAVLTALTMIQSNVVWCGVPSMTLRFPVLSRPPVFVFHAPSYLDPRRPDIDQPIPVNRTSDRTIEAPAVTRKPVERVSEIRRQDVRDALRERFEDRPLLSAELNDLKGLPGVDDATIDRLKEELGPDARVRFVATGDGDLIIRLDGNSKAVEVIFPAGGGVAVAAATPAPAALIRAADVSDAPAIRVEAPARAPANPAEVRRHGERGIIGGVRVELRYDANAGHLVAYDLSGRRIDENMRIFTASAADANGRPVQVRYSIHHFEVDENGQLLAKGAMAVGAGQVFRDGTIGGESGGGDNRESATPVSHGLDVAVRGDKILFRGQAGGGEVAFTAAAEAGLSDFGQAVFQPVTAASYDIVIENESGIVARAGSQGRWDAGSGQVFRHAKWSVTAGDDRSAAPILQHFGISGQSSALIDRGGHNVGRVTLDATKNVTQVVGGPSARGHDAIAAIYLGNRPQFAAGGRHAGVDVGMMGEKGRAVVFLSARVASRDDVAAVSAVARSMEEPTFRGGTRQDIERTFMSLASDPRVAGYQVDTTLEIRGTTFDIRVAGTGPTLSGGPLTPVVHSDDRRLDRFLGVARNEQGAPARPADPRAAEAFHDRILTFGGQKIRLSYDEPAGHLIAYDMAGKRIAADAQVFAGSMVDTAGVSVDTRFAVHHFEVDGNNQLVARGSAQVVGNHSFEDGTVGEGGSGGGAGAGPISHGLNVDVDGNGKVFFSGNGEVAFTAAVGENGSFDLKGATFQPVTAGSHDMVVSVGGQEIASAGAQGLWDAKAGGRFSYSAWTVKVDPATAAPAVQKAIQHFNISAQSSTLLDSSGLAVGRVALDAGQKVIRITTSGETAGRAAAEKIFFGNQADFSPGGAHEGVEVALGGTKGQSSVILSRDVVSVDDLSRAAAAADRLEGLTFAEALRPDIEKALSEAVGGERGVARFETTIKVGDAGRTHDVMAVGRGPDAEGRTFTPLFGTPDAAVSDKLSLAHAENVRLAVNLGGREVIITTDGSGRLVPEGVDGKPLADATFKMSVKGVDVPSVDVSYRINSLEVSRDGSLVARATAEIAAGTALDGGFFDSREAGSGSQSTAANGSRRLDVTVGDDNRITIKAAADGARVDFVAEIGSNGIDPSKISFQPIGAGATDITVSRGDKSTLASIPAAKVETGASGNRYQIAAWSVGAITDATKTRDLQILQRYGIQDGAGVIVDAEGGISGRVTTAEGGKQNWFFDASPAGDAAISDLYFNQQARFGAEGDLKAINANWVGSQASIQLGGGSRFDIARQTLRNLESIDFRHAARDDIEKQIATVVGASAGVERYSIRAKRTEGGQDYEYSVWGGRDDKGGVGQVNMASTHAELDGFLTRPVTPEMLNLPSNVRLSKSLSYTQDPSSGQIRLRERDNGTGVTRPVTGETTVAFEGDDGLKGNLRIIDGRMARIWAVAGDRQAALGFTKPNGGGHTLTLRPHESFLFDYGTQTFGGSWTRIVGHTTSEGDVRVQYELTRDARNPAQVYSRVLAYNDPLSANAMDTSRAPVKGGRALLSYKPEAVRVLEGVEVAQGRPALAMRVTDLSVDPVTGVMDRVGYHELATNERIVMPEAKDAAPGRRIDTSAAAGSRNLAIRRVADGVEIRQVDGSKEPGRVQITARERTKVDEPWQGQLTVRSTFAENLHFQGRVTVDGVTYNDAILDHQVGDGNFKLTLLKPGESSVKSGNTEITAGRRTTHLIFHEHQLQTENTPDHPNVQEDLRGVRVRKPGVTMTLGLFTDEAAGGKPRPYLGVYSVERSEGQVNVLGLDVNIDDIDVKSMRVREGRVMGHLKDGRKIELTAPHVLRNGRNANEVVTLTSVIKVVGWGLGTDETFGQARTLLQHHVLDINKPAKAGKSKDGEKSKDPKDRSEANSADTGTLNVNLEDRGGYMRISGRSEWSSVNTMLYNSGRDDRIVATANVFSDHAYGIRIVGRPSDVLGPTLSPGLVVDTGIMSRGEFTVSTRELAGRNGTIRSGRTVMTLHGAYTSLPFSDGRAQLERSRGLITIPTAAPRLLRMRGMSMTGGTRTLITSYRNGRRHTPTNFTQYYTNTSGRAIRWGSGGAMLAAGGRVRVNSRGGVTVLSGLILPPPKLVSVPGDVKVSVTVNRKDNSRMITHSLPGGHQIQQHVDARGNSHFIAQPQPIPYHGLRYKVDSTGIRVLNMTAGRHTMLVQSQTRIPISPSVAALVSDISSRDVIARSAGRPGVFSCIDVRFNPGRQRVNTVVADGWTLEQGSWTGEHLNVRGSNGQSYGFATLGNRQLFYDGGLAPGKTLQIPFQGHTIDVTAHAPTPLLHSNRTTDRGQSIETRFKPGDVGQVMDQITTNGAVRGVVERLTGATALAPRSPDPNNPVAPLPIRLKDSYGVVTGRGTKDDPRVFHSATDVRAGDLILEAGSRMTGSGEAMTLVGGSAWTDSVLNAGRGIVTARATQNVTSLTPPGGAGSPDDGPSADIRENVGFRYSGQDRLLTDGRIYINGAGEMAFRPGTWFVNTDKADRFSPRFNETRLARLNSNSTLEWAIEVDLPAGGPGREIERKTAIAEQAAAAGMAMRRPMDGYERDGSKDPMGARTFLLIDRATGEHLGTFDTQATKETRTETRYVSAGPGGVGSYQAQVETGQIHLGFGDVRLNPTEKELVGETTGTPRDFHGNAGEGAYRARQFAWNQVSFHIGPDGRTMEITRFRQDHGLQAIGKDGEIQRFDVVHSQSNAVKGPGARTQADPRHDVTLVVRDAADPNRVVATIDRTASVNLRLAGNLSDKDREEAREDLYRTLSEVDTFMSRSDLNAGQSPAHFLRMQQVGTRGDFIRYFSPEMGVTVRGFGDVWTVWSGNADQLGRIKEWEQEMDQVLAQADQVAKGNVTAANALYGIESGRREASGGEAFDRFMFNALGFGAWAQFSRPEQMSTLEQIRWGAQGAIEIGLTILPFTKAFGLGKAAVVGGNAAKVAGATAQTMRGLEELKAAGQVLRGAGAAAEVAGDAAKAAEFAGRGALSLAAGGTRNLLTGSVRSVGADLLQVAMRREMVNAWGNVLDAVDKRGFHDVFSSDGLAPAVGGALWATLTAEAGTILPALGRLAEKSKLARWALDGTGFGAKLENAGFWGNNMRQAATVAIGGGSLALGRDLLSGKLDATPEGFGRGLLSFTGGAATGLTAWGLVRGGNALLESKAMQGLSTSAKIYQETKAAQMAARLDPAAAAVAGGLESRLTAGMAAKGIVSKAALETGLALRNATAGALANVVNATFNALDGQLFEDRPFKVDVARALAQGGFLGFFLGAGARAMSNWTNAVSRMSPVQVQQARFDTALGIAMWDTAFNSVPYDGHNGLNPMTWGGIVSERLNDALTPLGLGSPKGPEEDPTTPIELRLVRKFSDSFRHMAEIAHLFPLGRPGLSPSEPIDAAAKLLEGFAEKRLADSAARKGFGKLLELGLTGGARALAWSGHNLLGMPLGLKTFDAFRNAAVNGGANLGVFDADRDAHGNLVARTSWDAVKMAGLEALGFIAAPVHETPRARAGERGPVNERGRLVVDHDGRAMIEQPGGLFRRSGQVELMDRPAEGERQVELAGNAMEPLSEVGIKSAEPILRALSGETGRTVVRVRANDQGGAPRITGVFTESGGRVVEHTWRVRDYVDTVERAAEIREGAGRGPPEGRSFADLTLREALLSDAGYTAAAGSFYDRKAELLATGRDLTPNEVRELQDLHATQQVAGYKRALELERAKVAAEPAESHGLVADGLGAFTGALNELRKRAEHEESPARGFEILAGIHGLRELAAAAIRSDAGRVASLKEQTKESAARDLVDEVFARETGKTKERDVSLTEALTSLLNAHGLDVRSGVNDRHFQTLLAERSTRDEREAAMEALFPGKTSVAELTPAEMIAYFVALNREYVVQGGHVTRGEKISGQDAKQSALLVEFMLGRLAGLAAGAGKSNAFTMGFAEFAARSHDGSAVGELIVYGPDEVSKYVDPRQYLRLGRAMGIEFVDGRGLEKADVAAWRAAYDPAVGAEGRFKVVVLDYHTRGFMENDVRANRGSEKARLLRNVQVQGLDEADALLLSRMSFISSDGNKVATADEVRRGRAVVDRTLTALGYERPRHVDLRQEWRTWSADRPDVAGYREFRPGEIVNAAQGAGRWFTSHEGKIIVSEPLMKEIVESLGREDARVVGREIEEALRAVVSVHDTRRLTFIKDERGIVRPTLMSDAGKPQKGQIDSSTTFNVAAVLLHNQLESNAGRLGEGDIRLSEAGSMATFVQVLQTPVQHRFGATGTPESMKGLAEHVIGMKVVDVDPSTFHDYTPIPIAVTGPDVTAAVRKAYDGKRATEGHDLAIVEVDSRRVEDRAIFESGIIRGVAAAIELSISDINLNGGRGAGVVVAGSQAAHKATIVDLFAGRLSESDAGRVRSEFEADVRNAGVSLREFVDGLGPRLSKLGVSDALKDVASRLRVIDGLGGGDAVEQIAQTTAKEGLIVLSNESGLRAVSFDAKAADLQVDLVMSGFEGFSKEGWLQALARVDRGQSVGARRTVFLDTALLDGHLAEARAVDQRLREDGRDSGLFGDRVSAVGEGPVTLSDMLNGRAGELSVVQKLELVAEYRAAANRAQSALFFIGEQASVQLLKQPVQQMLAGEREAGHERGAAFLENVYREILSHSDKGGASVGTGLQDYRRIAADSFNGAAKTSVEFLLHIANEGERHGVSRAVVDEARFRAADIVRVMRSVGQRLNGPADAGVMTFVEVSGDHFGSPAAHVLDVATQLANRFLLPNTSLGEAAPHATSESYRAEAAKLSAGRGADIDGVASVIERTRDVGEGGAPAASERRDRVASASMELLRFGRTSAAAAPLAALGYTGGDDHVAQAEFLATFSRPSLALSIGVVLGAASAAADDRDRMAAIRAAVDSPDPMTALTGLVPGQAGAAYADLSGARDARAGRERYLETTLKDGGFQTSPWTALRRSAGNFVSGRTAGDDFRALEERSLASLAADNPSRAAQGVAAFLFLHPDASASQIEVIQRRLGEALAPADSLAADATVQDLEALADPDLPDATAIRDFIAKAIAPTELSERPWAKPVMAAAGLTGAVATVAALVAGQTLPGFESITALANAAGAWFSNSGTAIAAGAVAAPIAQLAASFLPKKAPAESVAAPSDDKRSPLVSLGLTAVGTLALGAVLNSAFGGHVPGGVMLTAVGATITNAVAGATTLKDVDAKKKAAMGVLTSLGFAGLLTIPGVLDSMNFVASPLGTLASSAIAPVLETLAAGATVAAATWGILNGPAQWLSNLLTGGDKKRLKDAEEKAKIERKASGILDALTKKRDGDVGSITIADLWAAILADDSIEPRDRLDVLRAALMQAGLQKDKADQVCECQRRGNEETEALGTLTLGDVARADVDFWTLVDVRVFEMVWGYADWGDTGAPDNDYDFSPEMAEKVAEANFESTTPTQDVRTAMRAWSRLAGYALSLRTDDNAAFLPVIPVREVAARLANGTLHSAYADVLVGSLGGKRNRELTATDSLISGRARALADRQESVLAHVAGVLLRSGAISDDVAGLIASIQTSGRWDGRLGERLDALVSDPATSVAVRTFLEQFYFNAAELGVIASAGERAPSADEIEQLSAVWRAGPPAIPPSFGSWEGASPAYRAAGLFSGSLPLVVADGAGEDTALTLSWHIPGESPRTASLVPMRDGIAASIHVSEDLPTENPIILFGFEPNVEGRANVASVFVADVPAGWAVESGGEDGAWAPVMMENGFAVIDEAAPTFRIVAPSNGPADPAFREIELVNPLFAGAVEPEAEGRFEQALIGEDGSRRSQASAARSNAKRSVAADRPVETVADGARPSAVSEPKAPEALPSDPEFLAAWNGWLEELEVRVGDDERGERPQGEAVGADHAPAAHAYLRDVASAPSFATVFQPSDVETGEIAFRASGNEPAGPIFLRLTAGWIRLTPAGMQWVVQPDGDHVKIFGRSAPRAPGEGDSSVSAAPRTGLMGFLARTFNLPSLLIIGSAGLLAAGAPADAAGAAVSAPAPADIVNPAAVMVTLVGARLALASTSAALSFIRSFGGIEHRERALARAPHPFVVPVPTAAGRKAVRFSSAGDFAQTFFRPAADDVERVFARTATYDTDGELVISEGRELRTVSLDGGPDIATPAVRELAEALAALPSVPAPVFGETRSNAKAVEGLKAFLAKGPGSTWAGRIRVAPLIRQADIPEVSRAALPVLGDNPTLADVAGMEGFDDLKHFIFQLVLHHAEVVASPKGSMVSGATLERVSKELGAPLILHHAHPGSTRASLADRITAGRLYAWGVARGVIAPAPFLISNADELTFHDDVKDVLLTMSARKDIVDVRPVDRGFESLRVGPSEEPGAGRPGFWARLRALVVGERRLRDPNGLFPSELDGERGPAARAGLELAWAIHELGLSAEQIRAVWGLVAEDVFSPGVRLDVDSIVKADRRAGIDLASLIRQLSAQIRQSHSSSLAGGLNMAGSGHLPDIGLAVNQYLDVAALPASLTGPEADWALREIGRALDLDLISPAEAGARARDLRHRRAAVPARSISETLLSLAGLHRADFMERLARASTGGFTVRAEVEEVLAGKAGDAVARSAALNILVQPLVRALASASGLPINDDTARLLSGLRVEIVPAGEMDPRITHRTAGLLNDEGGLRIQIADERGEDSLEVLVGRLAHELGHALAHQEMVARGSDRPMVPTLAEEAWVGLAVSRGLRWMGLPQLADSVELETLDAIVRMQTTQAFYLVYDDLKSDDAAVNALVDQVRSSKGATRVVVIAPAGEFARAVGRLGRLGLHVVSVDAMKGLVPAGRESRLETHARLFLGTSRVRLVLRRGASGTPLSEPRYAGIRDVLLRAGGAPALELVEEIVAEKLSAGLKSVIDRQITALKHA